MTLLIYAVPGLLWYALFTTQDRPARAWLSQATGHLTLAECEAGRDINLRIVGRYLRSVRRSHPFERRVTRYRRRIMLPRAQKALIMATVLEEHIASHKGEQLPSYLRSRRKLWKQARRYL